MHELTLKEENEINEVAVSLHPHKALLDSIHPKVYIIRKGWPAFIRFCKAQREAKKAQLNVQ